MRQYNDSRQDFRAETLKSFEELDERTLQALAYGARAQQFQKDEVLFVAGEEATGLYLIAEGAVRAFRVSADGSLTILATRRREQMQRE